ncbi:M56 family metallopeptidase [Paenibacillus donghaensis]|uniref:Peptidase M56 domain-containing protein n=1 Tax=Paenibacillus donghaensis TaxID=414771 RepID=A0A2Z2KSZ3_9BACL|nr:M56 family metallopeptidase [Paenibacillus donghaensis]ASA24802.1 hypothetical protein B9T62_31010 [Paenibacillus donghaensis]
MKLIESMFSLLLTASLASSVIILLLLLLRKPLNKRLGARIVHMLWVIALIRLLVPIAPHSPVSLFNLLPQTIHDQVYLGTTLGSRAPSEPSEEINPSYSSISNQTEEPSSTNTAAHPQMASSETAHYGPSHWLAISWLGGILALGLYYLSVTLRFRKEVAMARKLENEEVLFILEACKAKLGIQRNIPIYETSSFHSPFIYGLLKPGVYLPEDLVAITDSAQLTHILLHELAHYKRKDLWVNFLWTLAVLIHWYNPLVWFAMKRMKADQEVACDAGVLEVLGERESTSYGTTLLMLSRLSSRRSSLQVHLTPFFVHKNEMKRRITMIMSFKKGSYKLSIAAVVLVFFISAVIFTMVSEPAGGAAPAADSNAGSAENSASSFKIARINDWAKWFNNLDRATAFADFDFKVSDYLPDGYQLQNVDVLQKYVNRTNDLANITYVTHFGTDEEQIIELGRVGQNGAVLCLPAADSACPL